MSRIGEDVSERLDVIPAQFRVLVTRRPKYACRRCSQAVAQAHAPEHVVPGGLPTELFIAWIIVSKFGDHLPFYRQAEIFKRQGIDLDRGTLGNWVGRACFHLMPIINHMRAHLRQADRILVDETRAPVLDPGRKTTKTGWSGPWCPMIAAMAGLVHPSCLGHSLGPCMDGFRVTRGSVIFGNWSGAAMYSASGLRFARAP